MSNLVIILGPTGSGKSTSIKNLDPKETMILALESINKTLPFKGSRKIYNKENKNYFALKNYEQIISYMDSASKNLPNIHNIILEDSTYIMRTEFFDRATETGFTKFTELADHFRRIIAKGASLRDDINVFMILHSEPITESGDIIGYKAATVGKLIDEKYNPLESVTITLFAQPKFDDQGNPEFGFWTKKRRVNGVELPCKCFAPGTSIIMADGSTKAVEDIRVGDLVLGTNSKPCKVSSLHSGKDQMYKVTQKYGKSYIVNSEHLLVTQSGNIAAKNATKYKNLLAVREKVDINNTVKYPYFIGLWLGDGAKDAISITTADTEIEEYLKEIASKENLQLSIYDKTKSKAVEVNLSGECSYSKEIYQYSLQGELLKKYDSIQKAAEENKLLQSNIIRCAKGIYHSCGGYVWKYGKIQYKNTLRELLKAYDLINNKHIPKEFFNTSVECKQQLLAGLIDTDGTKSDNRYVVSTKEKNLAQDIMLIAKSCGYTSYIATYFNKKYQKDYYRITIAGNVEDIPVRINRKKIDKPSRENNYLSVELVGVGEYYGFSLEGECKTFFLEDYTVVHNSPDGMFEEDFIPNDLNYVIEKMNEYYG